MENLSADESVGVLNSQLFYLIESYVPKYRTFMSSFPSWFSRELRQAISNKKRAHAVWKSSNLQCNFHSFSFLRARCKELVKRDYASYMDRLEGNISCNIKAFWGHVNSLRGDTLLPTSMHLGDEVADSDVTIANLFCTTF